MTKPQTEFEMGYFSQLAFPHSRPRRLRCSTPKERAWGLAVGRAALPALTSCAVSSSRALRLRNSLEASPAVARAPLDSGKMPRQGRPAPQAVLLSRGQSSPSHRAGVQGSARNPPQIWRGRERWGSEGTRLAGETSVPSGRQTSPSRGTKFRRTLAEGAGELAALALQKLCTGTGTEPALPDGLTAMRVAQPK